MKPGWRHFECELCGLAFHQTCRDFESPSLTTCPACYEEVSPKNRWPDSGLNTDKSGNVLSPVTSFYADGLGLDERRKRARAIQWRRLDLKVGL